MAESCAMESHGHGAAPSPLTLNPPPQRAIQVARLAYWDSDVAVLGSTWPPLSGTAPSSPRAPAGARSALRLARAAAWQGRVTASHAQDAVPNPFRRCVLPGYTPGPLGSIWARWFGRPPLSGPSPSSPLAPVSSPPERALEAGPWQSRVTASHVLDAVLPSTYLPALPALVLLSPSFTSGGRGMHSQPRPLPSRQHGGRIRSP